NTFPKRLSLRGLKIVVDCAHGATYRVSPTVLRELGADVVTLNVAPDGLNINAKCGSLFPEVVQRAVVAEGAHAGFTHDGDGDRLLCVDEHGALVDGDQILALCGLDMLAEGRLPSRTVVATVMSNAGLDVSMGQAGIRVVRTPVGDRPVLEAMLQGGHALGGEQSGHIIFAEHNTTGDGIVTALQVLAAMLRAGKPLSELAACMPRFPQVLENVRIQRKDDLRTLPAVQTQIREAERALAGKGRVLVRFSGTEPLVRVMVEGPDETIIRHWAGVIAAAIREALG
ncbi:MAG: phosphoglucosamine mutase, partial [Candidatus Methylomirabilota bacterium]